MGVSSALGSSALLPAGLGFRNKFINGNMVIAQRGTTAVTGSGSAQYPVDRWAVYNNVGTVTFQQSSVAPAGFRNSIVATVTATGSYGTNGYTQIGQTIEGLNVADLAWGTSSAKPITLSFWTRSSVTGSYNVAIQNGTAGRSYVTTFTINTANTWEYKTIYVNGDTSGTWATDNTTGLRVWFDIGMGTAFDTAGNVWFAGNAYSTAGTIDFAANAGATFYLTGVQLEQNYQPTPFEQRPIGAELALCQRYYEKSYDVDTAPGTNTNNGLAFYSGMSDVNGNVFCYVPIKVEKRNASYTVTLYTNTGTINQWSYSRNGAAAAISSFSTYLGTKGFTVYTGNIGVGWVVAQAYGHWVCNNEL